MATSTTHGRLQRGRPRDLALDEAVLTTTLDHLARHGYRGTSIDSIAAEVGCGKPSIYRRWPGKADLATAALMKLQSEEPRVVGATTRERLVSHLRGFRRSLLRPNGMALLGTLLAEEARTPELMRLFRERILARRRTMLTDLLREGILSTEIHADADVDAAVNLLVGSFYARYLAGQPITEQWPERAVALVWPALAAVS